MMPKKDMARIGRENAFVFMAELEQFQVDLKENVEM